MNRSVVHGSAGELAFDEHLVQPAHPAIAVSGFVQLVVAGGSGSPGAS